MEDKKFYIKEGFILNPNEKVVNGILKGLERNGGHCPCKAYRKEDNCCCTLYIKNKKKKENE